MKVMKKAGVMLTAIVMCFTLCACNNPLDKLSESKIPDATSADWGLYLQNKNGVDTIVDENGQLSFNYSFDKKGNVIDANKTIIIGKDNLSRFIPVSEFVLDENSLSEVILDTEMQEKTPETGNTVTGQNDKPEIITVPLEKKLNVEIEVKPVEATTKKLLIESSNPDIAAIGKADKDGVLSLDCDEQGKGAFELICKNEGAISINIASADSGYERNYNVVIKLNEKAVNAEEFEAKLQETMEDNKPEPREEPKPAAVTTPTLTTDRESNAISVNPTQDTAETVVVTPDNTIPTTESTPGWVNGSKVNLREEKNTTSKVLGTYTSGKALTILGQADGWSKVQIDGNTGYLKSVYITTNDPNQQSAAATSGTQVGTVVYSGTNSSSTNNRGTSSYYSSNSSGTYTSSTSTGSSGTASTQVNAPIASNDGYDHGYAFSSETSPAGNPSHSHDFRVSESKAPSGSDSGYTMYTCSCGESYKGPYCAEAQPGEITHVHNYNEKVHQPTCDNIGYTEHTCSCGDMFFDAYVPAKGHSFTSEVQEDGSVKYTCENCQYSYIEESNAEN